MSQPASEDAGQPYASVLLQRPGAVAQDVLAQDAVVHNHGTGVAWHYGDPVGEQRAAAQGLAVTDLSDHGLLAVTGADRVTWLGDLLSQELTGLAVGDSTEALLLSPQGRIEYAMAVLAGSDTLWLILDSFTAAQGLARWLDSMRFTRRVEVQDVTGQWAALGTSMSQDLLDSLLGEGSAEEANAGQTSAGTSAASSDSASRFAAGDGLAGENHLAGAMVWQDHWPQVRIGGAKYAEDRGHPGFDRTWRILLIPRQNLDAGIGQLEAAGLRLIGSWASEALRIAAWRPSLSQEVDSRSIPHELDWLRTAVHLKKGCYRGQETVAMVHNVGHPPRRLVFLHVDGSSNQLPAAGWQVYAEGKLVGQVTSAAQHYELGPIALAVIKRTTPAHAQLSLLPADADNGDGAAGGMAGVAALQEIIVPVAGEAASRPAPRGQLTRGLRAPGGSMSLSLAGSGGSTSAATTTARGQGITIGRQA